MADIAILLAEARKEIPGILGPVGRQRVAYAGIEWALGEFMGTADEFTAGDLRGG